MLKRKLLKSTCLSASLLSVNLAFAGDKEIISIDTSGKNSLIEINEIIKENHGQDFTDSSISMDYTVVNKSNTEVPKVKLNINAAKFIKNYHEENDQTLLKVKESSEPYFKIINGILNTHGLPVELKYLAVVESKLKRTAMSRAGAAGPWQLMPATARYLGLKVNGKTDERKNYHKSTTAAAKYLKSLYIEYSDWLLVIAAYNAGPGTINKAIRNSGSSNFWKLQFHLPAETRNHVKRFIGAHYYFENEGSKTTVTKAEREAYEKAMAKYITETEKNKEVIQLSIPLTSGNLDEKGLADLTVTQKQK
jgi:membrane-bound lytic murein transglycosylase D